MEKLGELTVKESEKDLLIADAKDIFMQFFDPAAEEFTNIKMVMQAIAVSSVKHICVSVLESFISRYENHFDGYIFGVDKASFAELDLPRFAERFLAQSSDAQKRRIFFQVW